MAFFVYRELPQGRRLRTFAIVKVVAPEEVEVAINHVHSDCSVIKIIRKPISLSTYIELVQNNNACIEPDGWREENTNLMLACVLTKYRIFREMENGDGT